MKRLFAAKLGNREEEYGVSSEINNGEGIKKMMESWSGMKAKEMGMAIESGGQKSREAVWMSCGEVEGERMHPQRSTWVGRRCKKCSDEEVRFG